MTASPATETQQPSRSAGRLELLVKTAITLGLLGFLLTKVDLEAAARQAVSIGLRAFILSVLWLLVLSLLVTIRWHVILNAIKSPLSLRTCWRLVMIGMFFNQTLPSSIGGDAVRIWLLTRLAKPLGVAFVSVALDRVFALVAVGACVLLALLLVLTGPVAVLAAFASLLAVLGCLVLLGFDSAADRLSPVASRLAGERVSRWVGRPIVLLRELSRAFGLVLRRPGASSIVLGISVLNQLALGLVVYFIARELGTGLNLVSAVLIFPLAILLTTIPISLGGWGVREVSMVWLFGTVGLSPEEALGISVVFGLALTAAGLPGGLLWLLDRRSAVMPSRDVVN